MEKFIPVVVGTVITAALLVANGCSSLPGQSEKSGQELASSGPTVVDTRTNPRVIELNNQLQPNATPEIFADVKDFQAGIQQVKLRFLHVPLELPMQNVNGTSWRATLTPDQVKQLAVGGQTMKYQANVIAVDDKGQIATSNRPVEIAIKSPEPSEIQRSG